MLMVWSNCKDPAQEQAFNDWYTNVHVPDVVATGWVVNGMRYRNLATSLDSGDARYLAIYETDRWDMEDMLEDIRTTHTPRWQEQGRTNPNLQGVRGGVFRKCGPPFRPETSAFTTEKTGKAPITGLLVALSTCTEPMREGDFNNWYNRVYVPKLVAEGPFHTAYRYCNSVRDADGKHLFVALYETDALNPEAEIKHFLGNWQPPARRSPYVQELGYSIFTPI